MWLGVYGGNWGGLEEVSAAQQGVIGRLGIADVSRSGMFLGGGDAE
jgi:hypothetical protein